MAKPNKPYIAGTVTIATGTTDSPVLENIFAADIITEDVTNWQGLLVGVANNFILTYNKQITVKLGYRNSKGDLVVGDAMVWRNPTPTTLQAKLENIQSRENHTLKIEEIYVSNAAGSDVVIDVQIYANNNGPFVN